LADYGAGQQAGNRYFLKQSGILQAYNALLQACNAAL
jgi:hypothetical protein